MKTYRLGYTAGVFDLFHVGHLNLLRAAKERCERLIVGVSTDELVMAVKQKRPVIPFEERLAIVRAIRYVDEAVPQHTRDKLSAYRSLGFDCLFKGTDWQGTPLWTQNERELAPCGVAVVYLPYTEGISSSILLERARTLR